ncbi:unnamed protein product [Symbiodinium sp. CCMP2592]|nr:unnamed protein product [Symbiodinium sp. CCMP2592]
MTIDGADDNASNEEMIMLVIKNFDKHQSEQLRAFVSNELPKPSALHTGLSKFRVDLNSKLSQFVELPDLAAQLELLLETMGKSGAAPSPWIAYTSAVSCQLKVAGVFPEGSQDIFVTEGNLGAICGLRARYTILALRSLLDLRVLKVQPACARMLQQMVNAVDAPELADHSLVTCSHDFGAALAGFDSVLSQSQDADWAAKWCNMFLNATSLSEATKILRESCGVTAEIETGEAVVPATPTADGDRDTVTSQVRSMQKSLCKPLISLADIHKAHVGVYDDGGLHDVLRDWDAFGEFLVQKDDVQSELGVRIDAVFLKALWQCTDAICRGLESLLWRLYANTKEKSDAHVFLVADAAAAATRERVVLCHAPDDMELPFVGPVSLNKTPQSLMLLQWGGVEFFVNPPPSPPAGDVVVPAWLAKHAGPKERSTVELKSEDIMIYISNHGAVSMTKPKPPPKKSPPAMDIGTHANLPGATQVTQEGKQATQESLQVTPETTQPAQNTPETSQRAQKGTATPKQNKAEVEVVDVDLDDDAPGVITSSNESSNAKLAVPIKKEKPVKRCTGRDLCDQELGALMFADERTPAAHFNPDKPDNSDKPEQKEIWNETDMTVYWLRVLNLLLQCEGVSGEPAASLIREKKPKEKGARVKAAADEDKVVAASGLGAVCVLRAAAGVAGSKKKGGDKKDAKQKKAAVRTVRGVHLLK